MIRIMARGIVKLVEVLEKEKPVDAFLLGLVLGMVLFSLIGLVFFPFSKVIP